MSEFNFIDKTDDTLETNQIPQDTTIINISNCINLKEIKELPDSVEEINITNLPSLSALPVSNTHLEKLKINDYSLSTIPNLPTGLKYLDLSDCSSLQTLPNLPTGLKYLDLSECESIQILPDLPQSLEYLNLSECSSLQTLPILPQSLDYLDLSDCSSLQTLPNLPQSLEYLDLSGCINLQPSEIIKLLDLERHNSRNPNFRLIWPSHLDRDPKIAQAKENIKEAYNSIGQEFNPNNNASFQTYQLFNRFTTESLQQRGGMEKVINQAFKISLILKDHPEVLEACDQSATNYLANCVNQPVAGFTEIAILAEIANQKEISQKLEKAKMLFVLETIKEEVTKLNPGDGVQVELGNAMYREVNNKLNNGFFSKKEEWPAVPHKVAYQEAIKQFLTDDNINTLTQVVKNKLAELTPQKIGEFLTQENGPYKDLWSKLVLSAEERVEIEKEYRDYVQSDAPDETRIRELKLESEANIHKKSKEKTIEAVRQIPNTTPKTPSVNNNNIGCCRVS